MSGPEDVAARGASIFERLRAETATPEEDRPGDGRTADRESEQGRADGDVLPDREGHAGQVVPDQEAAPSETVANNSERDARDGPLPAETAPADTAPWRTPPADPAPLPPGVVDGPDPVGDAIDDMAVPAPRGDAAASLIASEAPEASEELPAGAPSEEPSPFARPFPRILAIANQKGGVGKTTTAVNMGAALAELDYRVLIIDLDPQGNATTGLGIDGRNLDASVYDVILRETPVEDCIEPTSLKNLFVIPATIDLAGAEIELVPLFSRELRLRRALEQVHGDFEFVLIDCPPSLGLLTVNGLAAATEVIVPIQCEYYALEGLGQLLRNVNLVQGNLNPALELSAIVLTMYDARTKLADQVALDVREHFGEKVCRNVVPRTVRLSEAPSYGQPIILFDPSSRGALAYRELAKEVSGGAPQRAG